MKRLTVFLIFAFASFLYLTPLHGQENWTKAKVQQINKEAQEMAAAGQWEQAVEHLDQNLTAMGENGKLASYRAYLLFSKAYLLQQTPEGNEDQNLREAQLAYKSALQNQPNDLKIINNIISVSRSLKDWETAEAYTKEAIRIDSENTGDWYTVLGEIYELRGNRESSWQSYSDAIDQDPQNLDAAQKLLTLYDGYSYDYTDKLYQKCLELNEYGLSEMAMKGLEDIVVKLCENNLEIKDSIILSWAGILAGNNWVQPRLAKRLANMACDHEGFEQLGKNISEGWSTQLNRSDWWRENDRRYFFYQALQKSWADYLLSTGAKKEAMELYRSCRQESGRLQDFSAEIYGRSGVLEMEILIQLARLYGDKSLDQNGENFRVLEQELFEQKGEAYRSQDLESIQKFHTILGLIYVDQKKWEGGYAKNARFQLSNAISTAQRRAEIDPSVYTPLPHLYKYLGDTYTAIGNNEQAADAYLNAAIDYLETDNLTISKEMIDLADQHIDRESNRQTLKKRSEVVSILSTRESISELDANSFSKDNQRYFRNDSKFQWLTNARLIRTVESSVLERQRFKVLADLRAQAIKVGAMDESDILQTEARQKVEEVTILSSQQDVIRLKEMDSSNQNFNYKSLEIQQLKDEELKKDYNIILPNRSGQKTRILKTEGN